MSRFNLYHRSLQRPSTRPFLLLLFLLLLPLLLVARQETDASNGAAAAPVAETAGAPAFGVNFINSAEQLADQQQYANGLATGATWNRWPFYWFYIEQSPGSFNWSRHDTAVQADVANGLQTNAILLGTPGFYMSGGGLEAVNYQHRPRQGVLALAGPETATPQGLYASVFSDGDTPGANKTINPDNKWAVFVHEAVNRYKPGGVLAQASGWPAGTGITHWEMWNEPDLDIFWDASREDYARLLKVGYLAAKHADPAAMVMFGALANNFAKLDYYEDVMAIYDGDALAAKYGYYHDILATHSYFYAWQSWLHVWRAGNTLAERGLEKPIWFNETGVPAWDDYPGPVWDAGSPLRATMEEQAAYAIQSALYATFAGADAIFHFQLYDGCGNQPQGTDFPPHSGELCDGSGQFNGKPCAGDANGLFRNPPDAACFRQHPQPETPRPNFTAFQVLTKHFHDVEPYWRERPGDPKCLGPGGVEVEPQEWMAFYRPETRERIVGMWTLCGDAETAVLPAANPQGLACLVAPDGTETTIAAADGVYTIQLAGATNRNPFPGQSINAIYPIGGRPYLLIEPDPQRVGEPFLPAPATAGASAAGASLLAQGEQTFLPILYAPVGLPTGGCQ